MWLGWFPRKEELKISILLLQYCTGGGVSAKGPMLAMKQNVFLDINKDLYSEDNGSLNWKNFIEKSSVQFILSVMSNPLRPHEYQHARPPCLSQTPRVYSNSCPLSQWCHPAISSSVVPFSFCLSPSQHQGLFQWVSSSHEVAKVLEFQLQHQSFQWTPRTDLLQDGLVGSPCSPRDSQESSPTPQFKSINFSALSSLHSTTLISINDHWRNNSLDQTDLCRQSNVSAF